MTGLIACVMAFKEESMVGRRIWLGKRPDLGL